MGNPSHLIAHVGGQPNHGEVVDDENDLEVDGLPVFHETGAEPDDAEVKQEDERHRDRRVDQQPRVCPLVWNTTMSTNMHH